MEKIVYNKKIVCIIIRSTYDNKGIEFFTPNDFSIQMGYMKRPKNYVIKTHYHKAIEKKIIDVKEVLFVKKGKIKVYFYTKKGKKICNKIIKKGDLILLANYAHGFKMLQESELFEIKQGPYNSVDEKIHL
tara:strand:+ start:100 stop:492 length:393 start_codon:yes stop_codon:yes gene_type:complete